MVYYDSDNYPYFNCADADNLPTLELLFGGYWLEVSPKDYLLPLSRSSCSLCIYDAEEEEWLLGDAFLRGFYSTHDHDAKKFGFAPHSLSNKKSPYRGKVPDEKISTLTEDDITWIIVGSVGGAAILAVALYFALRNNCLAV